MEEDRGSGRGQEGHLHLRYCLPGAGAPWPSVSAAAGVWQLLLGLGELWHANMQSREPTGGTPVCSHESEQRRHGYESEQRRHGWPLPVPSLLTLVTAYRVERGREGQGWVAWHLSCVGTWALVLLARVSPCVALCRR